MHGFVLPHWIWIAFLSSVTIAGLLGGGRSERIGALVIFTGWLATVAVAHHHWNRPQWGMIGVDIIVLVLLLALGLRSSRWWPLSACGIQLLAALTHLAWFVDRKLGAWAYISAAVIWGYLLVGALAVGVLNRWRERRQPAASGTVSAEPGVTRR